MNGLRIGTSSWKYPSWKGLVYSDGVTDYLAEYARKYDTVEIDQWFWSLFPNADPKLPLPDDVQTYRSAVPDGFRFTVKAPNSITLTHPYARGIEGLAPPNRHFLSPQLAKEFLSLLAPLGPTLGPVIFQFEYLNGQKMPSQRLFQERLSAFRKELPDGQAYAIEIRNPHYLNEKYFGFLLEDGWQLALLHGYWMPSVVETWRRYSDLIRKFRVVIFRLHGTGREEIEEETGSVWNRVVTSREGELRAIAQMAKDLRGSKNEIYVNINNHYEGSAPLTIERFKNFLGS
jgi:uncharacterized protein YecE (DUF72 family)